MGVTSNHSRPPSRRKETGTGLKSAAANQKYSTISAAALNQLLQNPTKLVKADSVVAQEKPNLARKAANETLVNAEVDLRKLGKSQKRSENVHSTLPDIFGINTSEVKRGTRSPNATEARTHNNVLPEIPVQHVVRPLTPTDEFIHNKMRSKRGSSMVLEDEVQKRLRQKAILQEQIEEKRRQQEREEQERQKKIREDEERIKREIAMLNERFERERELELKQANKRLSAPHSAKVSLEPVCTKQLSRPQTPIAFSSNEPIKSTASELTVVENTTVRPSKSIGDTNVQNGHQTIVLSENATKLADDLQNLTELCRRLMQEQQIMKSELEEQRRQTVLLLQERKANEALKEQLAALQEQFSLLTPHERATLRVRDHRRKQETRSTTNAVKQEAKEDVAISSIIQNKLKKHATRRRGSWATQSKAIAPAARNSISEPITEGEVHHDHHNDNAHNLGEELGCTTKLVYPDDSVWHFDLCEPGVEGERSISPSSRRSPKEDWGSADDPGRILSRPGMASNKQSNPKPASVSKGRNRHS